MADFGDIGGEESANAAQSIRRGQLAAKLQPGSQAQRDYISAQGKAESGDGSRWSTGAGRAQAKAKVSSETFADSARAARGEFPAKE
jgi:hypothetical protein